MKCVGGILTEHFHYKWTKTRHNSPIGIIGPMDIGIGGIPGIIGIGRKPGGGIPAADVVGWVLAAGIVLLLLGPSSSTTSISSNHFSAPVKVSPHHNRFTAPFPGPPGWAGARRELLDFTVQGKINRGRHTDHPARCHSIWTKQCPPPPSPIFYKPDALPAHQRTASKHWSTSEGILQHFCSTTEQYHATSLTVIYPATTKSKTTHHCKM